MNFWLKLVLVLCCVWPVVAQDSRATLTGRIVDPTDAPIAGAAVTVKNEGTNAVATAKTDSHGNYTVTFLPPASYSVTVIHAGFRSTMRSGHLAL